MNFELLKDLINQHSVRWNEENMENFLINFAKKYNLSFTHNKGYGVVIWNPNSKIYCMAHIDEVWWVVTNIRNKKIKFKWIWRVKPNMFTGRLIEIKNKKNELINWLVVWKKPLKIDYERFWDLSILICENDLNKISIWDFLRYKSNFIETKDSIFWTSLDNRIWVFVLLEYILENIKNKEIFENMAFCFTTEEEIKNKWAKYYMNKYFPKIMLIFDVIPESFISKNYSTNTFILKKTIDYNLDYYFLKILSWFSNISYIESNSKLLKNSEPYQYQKITWWKAINIMCPLYNYHNENYFVEKKSLYNFFIFTKKIIEEIFNI